MYDSVDRFTNLTELMRVKLHNFNFHIIYIRHSIKNSVLICDTACEILPLLN